MIQVRPHPPDDRLGIFDFQHELGGHDQWFVEVGRPVVEAKILTLADDRIAAFADDCDAIDERPDRALPTAGVASERPADRAGDSGQNFQSPQTSASCLRDQGRSAGLPRRR